MSRKTVATLVCGALFIGFVALWTILDIQNKLVHAGSFLVLIAVWQGIARGHG